MEIELEKTYLLKYIPDGLEKCEHVEIEDIFIPESVEHPVLRIRRKGEKFEMTKKQPVVENDFSEQAEHTIYLSKKEYKYLTQLKGRRFRKIRYYYQCESGTAEIDIYKDDLEGLAVVDFEFDAKQAKEGFKMPDFCLADVTQDTLTAGGSLSGKKFSDIKSRLEEYGYKVPLFI